MAFIDDLKQGLSDVTKTVYEKSEQFVGIQKLRLKKNSLNSELKTTYIEIGKMVYEEKKQAQNFQGRLSSCARKSIWGWKRFRKWKRRLKRRRPEMMLKMILM